MKRLLVVALLLISLLLVVGPVGASDPPHWSSASTTIDCTSCHTTHQAPGGNLTAAAGNVNLCQSCHNPSGTASAMAINNSDKAVPGTSGTSHAFDTTTMNANFGTTTPTNTEMQLRVMDGNIVCSTCHDQHTAPSSKGGSPHISKAQKITALGSTGVLTSGGTYSGANGAWYLIEIQTAGNQSTAVFRYSKDNGTSWMQSGLTAGANVALDSGVTVSFGTGTYNTPERWQFYASWPFLRAAFDSGDNATGAKFCRDCHSDWTMDATGVETYNGNMKSHPVGMALGSGGRTYDRSIPLDGNGAAQGGGGADSNASNDLKLDPSGNVQCWSCHGVHHADSNTQTNDEP